jgi:hypothetical protein
MQSWPGECIPPIIVVVDAGYDVSELLRCSSHEISAMMGNLPR